MKKQLPLLCAVFFGSMVYSQSKAILQKTSAMPAVSEENQFLLGEDGTLKIEGTGSLKVFTEAALTVKDAINNLGTGGNFIVENDANLIQIANAVNTGDIHVERTVKFSAERKQYNYLGTPVAFKAGQNFRTIYNGITQALYYIETNNLFGSSSGVNVPGRGLAVKEPIIAGFPSGTQVTALFQGVPQNGTVILPITNKDPEALTWGYNLVGNPYPSNIDLMTLYEVNGGARENFISTTFYFWDNTNNKEFEQQGSGYDGQAYAMFNVLAGPGGTGIGSPSMLNTKVPTNIVKVGQGFLTRSLVSSYNFTFENRVRSGLNDGPSFLGRSMRSQLTNRYWLEIKAPSKIRYSMAVVYYPDGDHSLGLEDSRSMNASDEVFSLVEGEKISINAKNIFDDADVVPLGTRHFTSGVYTLSLGNKEGVFAAGQAIFLKDAETGIITNLSQGEYSFEAGAGETASRFEIVYKPQSILAANSGTKEEVSVYREALDFVIKTQTKKITDIEMYDTSGRLVSKMQPNSTKVNISGAALSSGVYILKITQGPEVSTRKVLK